MTPTRYTYLIGNWPTPRDAWLTWEERVNLCFFAGWDAYPSQTLAEAVATFTAECGGDPQAFLAYVSIQYGPRTIPHDQWTLRQKVQAEITLEQRKAKVRELKNLPYPHFHNQLQNIAGAWARLDNADVGFGQLSMRWHPHLTIATLLNPVSNVNYCFKLFESWDETFNAWAANTGGHHEKYLPQARDAVYAFLKKMDKGKIEPIQTDKDYIPPLDVSGGLPATSKPYVMKFGRRWYREDWETFRDALRRHSSSWRIWKRRYPKKASNVFPGR